MYLDCVISCAQAQLLCTYIHPCRRRRRRCRADLAGDELRALQAQLLDHLLPFLQGYIWQRDRFSLQLSTERAAPWQQRRGAAAGGSSRRRAASAAAAPQQAQQQLPPHLWGSVGFGDNIEDEWFIVWLLLELTRAFPVTARCASPLSQAVR